MLLTEVVLPGGMNGREIASELTRRNSRVRVVYMSGYTENAGVHHGRVDPGTDLLKKPFMRGHWPVNTGGRWRLKTRPVEKPVSGLRPHA